MMASAIPLFSASSDRSWINEPSILDGVDRELPEVGQRGIPCSEIVDGKANAHILEGFQGKHRLVDGVHERAFGNLQFEEGRAHARLLLRRAANVYFVQV
jgi:hypothetical protein